MAFVSQLRFEDWLGCVLKIYELRRPQHYWIRAILSCFFCRQMAFIPDTERLCCAQVHVETLFWMLFWLCELFIQLIPLFFVYLNVIWASVREKFSKSVSITLWLVYKEKRQRKKRWMRFIYITSISDLYSVCLLSWILGIFACALGSEKFKKSYHEVDGSNPLTTFACAFKRIGVILCTYLLRVTLIHYSYTYEFP